MRVDVVFNIIIVIKAINAILFFYERRIIKDIFNKIVRKYFFFLYLITLSSFILRKIKTIVENALVI